MCVLKKIKRKSSNIYCIMLKTNELCIGVCFKKRGKRRMNEKYSEISKYLVAFLFSLLLYYLYLPSMDRYQRRHFRILNLKITMHLSVMISQ